MAHWSVRFALFLLVASTLVLSSVAAQAQPHWLRISYAAGDAARSVTLTWNSTSVTTPVTVDYGLTVQYGMTAQSNDQPESAPGALGYVHSVTLSDLTPNTLYHYRATDETGASADFSFITAPADGCEPWTFVALGDGRSDDETGANTKWPDIVGEAVAFNPLFILDTGDLIRDGTSASQWVDWLTKSDAFNPSIPHLPSIGNHDNGSVEGDGALYNQLFALPRNTTSNTEDYYAFTAGNAVFAVLSTATFGDDAFAAQAQWLDDTLTQHADKNWKFVSLHHPVYSSNTSFFGIDFNHPPNEVGQNAALVPIFDKHHVDVVFAGHNHYYERFAPMKGGGGNDEGNLAASFEDGTVYLITGGAGAFTYDEFDIAGVSIDLVEWVCGSLGAARGSTFCSGKHHFVKVDINNETMTLTAISSTKQNLGDITPSAFDSITINKAVSDDCTPILPDPEPVEELAVDTAETTPDLAADVAQDITPSDTQSTPDLIDDSSPQLEPAPSDLTSTAEESRLDSALETKSGGTTSDGCGCRTAHSKSPSNPLVLWLLFGLGVVAARRKFVA
ncbi:MAG: hypothetical protein AUK47_26585 [Deltaproteobacteria bacterium CG2_30_63_29]|nr:MAG: hypothetical protein AUK47_26585 [Deltaproteobacteria bacterium CG2_30_63_29]PJB41315.1 MAG: hypothetical protein CO108_13265 [Deltaproteobacteria bacterium CG_4_9_14_3_um_filter_63_12]